jgi:hypothetical protein
MHYLSHGRYEGFEGLSVMADVVVEIPRYSTNHVKGEF